jgi:hypothetical protein
MDFMKEEIFSYLTLSGTLSFTVEDGETFIYIYIYIYNRLIMRLMYKVLLSTLGFSGDSLLERRGDLYNGGLEPIQRMEEGYME